MKQSQRNFLLFSLFFFAICLEDIFKNLLFNTWVQGASSNGIHPFRKPIFTCTTPFLLTVIILFIYQKRIKKKKVEKAQNNLLEIDTEYAPLRDQSNEQNSTKDILCYYFKISLIPLLSIASVIMIHYASNYTDFCILQLVHALNLIFSSLFSHFFTRHQLSMRQRLSVAFFFISYLFFSYGVSLDKTWNWHHYSLISLLLYFISNCFIYLSNVLEDRFIYEVIEIPKIVDNNNEQKSLQTSNNNNNQEKSKNHANLRPPSPKVTRKYTQVRLKQKIEPSYLCYLESIFGIFYSFLFIIIGNFLFGKSMLYEDLKDTLIMIKDIKILLLFLLLCLLSSIQKIISIIIVSETSPLQTYLSISCGDIVSFTINSLIDSSYNKSFLLTIICCISMIISLNLYSLNCKH